MSVHKGRRRPTREERSARALAGVDVASCDPKRVLQSIASDPTAPAAARIRAAVELDKMARAGARAAEAIAASGPERAADDVNSRGGCGDARKGELKCNPWVTFERRQNAPMGAIWEVLLPI